jgi:hypothetical protein
MAGAARLKTAVERPKPFSCLIRSVRNSEGDFTTVICDFPEGTRSFALSANEWAPGHSELWLFT